MVGLIRGNSKHMGTINTGIPTALTLPGIGWQGHMTASRRIQASPVNLAPLKVQVAKRCQQSSPAIFITPQ